MVDVIATPDVTRLLKGLLGEKNAETLRELTIGGNDIGSLGAGLIRQLIKAIGALPKDARALEDIVYNVISAQAVLSVVDVGTDFADFALGITFSRLLGPLEDAAVGGPVREFLRFYFRHDDIPVRLLVRAVETPSLTDADLIEAGIYAGIRDAGLRKLLILKRAQEAKEIFAEWRSGDVAEEQEIADNVKAGLAEVNSEISAITRDLRAADVIRDETDIKDSLRVLESEITKARKHVKP